MTILEVRDLHVDYRVRDGLRRNVLHAVDGVDLVVRRGTTHGLVGESGCGKTTLTRALLGLVAPASGQVLLDGENLVGLGRARLRELRPRMQVVFQDPYTSLDPRMTVREIVAEPLRIHHRYDAERVRELLDQVGLDADAGTRRPSAFSGGQRQRIGIARALALDPDVLILDEPVSALDKSVQAQVLNLLTRLQRELGLSYLFISHDLSVVRHVAHDVSVMQQGRIVETGTRATVFGDPAHAYTRVLMAAVPRARPPVRAS